MIPKVIHYCWFGRGQMPELAQKCIESWKKYLPEYEIKEWNEDNFDVNIIPYTAEAYRAKKYAFVSDYARFWILYNYGGLYFDTDVEIIRPMDDIIEAGPFMGCENPASAGATPMSIGVAPGLGLYREILDFYSTLHFVMEDGSLNTHTVVEYTTKVLCEHGLKNTNDIQHIADVNIYPMDYLNPKSFTTGKINITPNTRAIHHFAGSWLSASSKRKQVLNRYCPRLLRFLVICKHLLNGTRPL